MWGWGALEGDFQRFYAIDLQRAVFGEVPMSYRRFTTLIAALPSESAWGGFLRNRKARSIADVSIAGGG